MTSRSPCVFQSFDERSSPADVAPRVALLRAELARRGLDGFLVPRSDQHQGEYVPPCDERLAWVTGFTGSAGAAVILKDKAALVADGRYTLQAAAQTDTAVVMPVQLAQMTVEGWIEANLPSGARLGFDPWVHTPDQVRKLEEAVSRAGGVLVSADGNPVDAVWSNRPAPPRAPIRPYPDKLAGETAAAKIARLREALTAARCDALVVSDPHNLCWLLNIRGGDLSHTPLALCYGVVGRTGAVRLFVEPEKLTPEATDELIGVCQPFAPSELPAALKALGEAKQTVRLDSATCASAIHAMIEQAGGRADVGADPLSLMKARKNASEKEGARAAHRRDGTAVARFLAWFDAAAPGGELTEIDAAAELERCRRETNLLRDISFPTISGAGPNAALPHYRVSAASNRRIEQGIFLIDSGGQYEDGTTDITRTLAVGEVTPEMKDRYTRVLKGHIAISRAVFPKGVSGAQIDAFARQHLWEAGLDFDHGTGHGVGAYLSVHEGPQRIAKVGHQALEPGMILSNEPGYYKEGAYGIRIENLIIVEPRTILGAEREMLGFETITLAPYDQRLIERSLLTPAERDFVDAYHARVLAEIGPSLEGEARLWLERACAPL